MLCLYCKNPLLTKAYEEILRPLNVLCFEQADAFLEKLPEAKLVLVDEDKELLKKAVLLGYPQTFLFLTSQASDEEEEYHVLFKPFSAKKLLSKTELLLAYVRKGLTLFFETPHFKFTGATRTVLFKKDLKEVRLTEKEAELIQYLYENKDRVVSKEELLENIFGYREGVQTHTLETHISKLRQKMEDKDDNFFLRIDGGYRLNLQ